MYLLIATGQNTHFSIAIGNKGGIEQMKIVKKAYKQSELLLDEIKKMIRRKKVDGLIVVQGPGGFSALRIGIATANALAYAWQVPVVGIKSNEDSKDDKREIAFLFESGFVKLKKAKKNKFVVPKYGMEPNIT